MKFWEWLMTKFCRTQPPVSEYNAGVFHDHVYPEAKAEYEREKQKALRLQAERIARVKRLGYDVEIITRRDYDVVH
jgi:hypothetical protein